MGTSTLGWIRYDGLVDRGGVSGGGGHHEYPPHAMSPFGPRLLDLSSLSGVDEVAEFTHGRLG
jgi:hypothetical protein